MDAAWTALRSQLRDRLALRAEPLLIVGDVTIPAASLWNGARCWVSAFRAAGLVSGEQLTVVPRRHPALLEAVVGSLWHGLDLAIVPRGADDPFPAVGDRRAVVDLAEVHGLDGPHEALRCSTGLGTPATSGPRLRQVAEDGSTSCLDAVGVHAVLERVEGCHDGRVVLVDRPELGTTDVVADLLAPLCGGVVAVVWPERDLQPTDGLLAQLAERYGAGQAAGPGCRCQPV